MPSSPEKTVRERVAEVLAYHLLVDETEITPGANLREDLSADSLDMIEIAMSLEEEFELEPEGISEVQIHARMTTVADTVQLMEEKLKQKETA